jgi:lactate dehydrogenase-like 2-hydroxyacid dehydrogenase
MRLTRRWPDAAQKAAARDFDVVLNEEDRPLSRKELGDALASFDVVCPTITDRIDAELLGSVPVRARALCNFGAGLNHIDVAACRAAGIIVTSTPDVLTEDTADTAIMLALMASRRAGEGERLIRAGGWSGWTPTQMLGTSLSGKTLGIVGFGRIGQAVARRGCHGFGMRVLYYARSAAPSAVTAEIGATWMQLDELLAAADIVSLHIPGGSATRHLIDARRLSLMKSGAILVNTARGDVIDEQALAAVLREGRIGGAGLDVYEREPEVAAELTGLDNAVLLPHLGSATLETRTAMGLRALANASAIAVGRVPPDLA